MTFLFSSYFFTSVIVRRLFLGLISVVLTACGNIDSGDPADTVKMTANYLIRPHYLYLQNLNILNTNEFTIKDVKVECDTYGESGTIIDRSDITLYKKWVANESKNFPEVELFITTSQAKTYGCAVVKYERD